MYCETKKSCPGELVININVGIESRDCKLSCITTELLCVTS